MLSAETYRALERAVAAAAELAEIDPLEADLARQEIVEVLDEWRAGEPELAVRAELELIGDVVLERHPTIPAPPPAAAHQGA